MTSDGRVAALILAAGASRRLGTPKQLVRLGGQTLLQRAVAAAEALPLESVHVVLGAHAAECRNAIAQTGAICHVNADWRNGMGRSLACGVERIAATRDAAAALVLHVDQYRIRAAELAALLAGWRGAPDRVVAATYGGTVGPPAIFPRRLFAVLQSRVGERGAKEIVSRPDCSRISMPAAAYDLDTPADLEILEKFAARKA